MGTKKKTTEETTTSVPVTHGNKPNIELGDEVKDRITGYQGIVVVTEIYSNGVTRAGVQSTELHEGKPVDALSFDFEDLLIVTKHKVPPIPVSYDGPVTFGDEVKTRAGYVGIVENIRTSLSGCVQFGVYARKLNEKTGIPVQGVLEHSNDVTIVTSKKEAEFTAPAGKGTGPAKIARAAR